MIYQQALNIRGVFSMRYGTNMSFAIEPMETGNQLVIPFKNERGAGSLVVRTATARDCEHPEVEEGMLVVLVTNDADGSYSLRAGSTDEDQLVNDLVQIATEVVGVSTDAESAEG